MSSTNLVLLRGQPLARLKVSPLVQEFVRLAGILACAVVLTQPLLTLRWLGGGDYYFYLHNLSDFLLQVRGGVFPPIVGQTDFLYNGQTHAVSDMGPYFGAALDFVTLHHLSALGILNLSLALSIIAAGLTMYACLCAVGANRWIAAFAAILYMSSPAMLAPTYTMDMVPTVLVAPYVPVLFYAAVRFVRSADFKSCVLAAVSLALILSSHAMVAIWAALFAGAVIVVAFAMRHRRFSVALKLAGTLGLFGSLITWLVVPVSQLNQGNVADYEFAKGFNEAIFYRPEIYLWLAEHRMWPITQLKPVPDPPTATSVQLGYALWVFIALGLLAAFHRKASLDLRLIAGTTALVMVLLFPIPFLSVNVYRLLPKFYELAGTPEERMYLLLAGLAAFVCALGWRHVAVDKFAHALLVGVVVALVCVWNFHEADKFLRYAALQVTSPAGAEAAVLTENASIYPYHTAPTPGYVGPQGSTHTFNEVFDPALDNAVLDDSGQPLISNLDELRAKLDREPSLPLKYSDAVTSGASGPTWKADGVTSAHWQVLMSFTIQPRKRYFLSYGVRMANATGMLQVLGDRLRVRESNLFQLVNPSSPGLVPTDWGYFALWTSESTPQTLSMRAVVDCADASRPCSAGLGPFHLQSYSLDDVPVRVVSNFPYRAQLESATPGFLETQRMYFPGYVASVNGVQVDTARSGHGRLMVPVQPGNNTVDVEYRGTSGMIASRWVSVLAWLFVAGLGAAWTTQAVRHHGRQTAAVSSF